MFWDMNWTGPKLVQTVYKKGQGRLCCLRRLQMFSDTVVAVPSVAAACQPRTLTDGYVVWESWGEEVSFVPGAHSATD